MVLAVEPSRSHERTDALPSGWTWATMADIAETVHGVAKGRDLVGRRTVRLPYLRVANVQRGWLDLGEVKEIELPVEEVQKYLLCENDLLLTEGGDWDKLGRSAVWANQVPNCIHQNHIFRARPYLPGYPTKWLMYYTNSEQGRAYFVKASKQVTNLASINHSQLKACPVPLAPLAEQRRIVAEIEKQFSRLDAAVAALKRAQANLRRYRASVLKAACEGRLVPQDPNDEPASELLKRVLDARRAAWEVEQSARMQARGVKPRDRAWTLKYQVPALPAALGPSSLPLGWCWASLSQLSWDAGYGTSQKCDYDAPGPPVLRIPNVAKGKVDLADMKRSLALDGFREGEVLTEGDLLVVRTNGSLDLIGRSALVRGDFREPHYHASYLIRYRLLKTTGVAEWMAAIWDSPAIREQILRGAATSAGQYNVNLASLGQLSFPLPPLAEQRRIVAEMERRLSVVDELETAVEANLKRTARLRQAILKRAFEGRLVPQDPNDEPAAVLLERIRAERRRQDPIRRSRGGTERTSGLVQ